MAKKRIIGVDFGTSTSVIRVKSYEEGKSQPQNLDTKEVVFGGMGAMVPTLIQKKEDNESVVYYGFEAKQKRKKTSTYHSFKVDLENSDADKKAQARRLTEEFFCFMAEKYNKQKNDGHLGEPDEQEQTIVSYPVKWSEETRAFMLEAAKKAGFPNVSGMDEAQAAIHAVTAQSSDYLKQQGLLMKGVPTNILLIDMGAGTTDLVLCRYTAGAQAEIQVLNTWPKSGEILFGGKEVDYILQDFFRTKMDPIEAENAFERIGIDSFKSWKEEVVSPALSKKDTVKEFFMLDNYVDLVGIEMEEYELNRESFEQYAKDYLTQLPRLVSGCLKDANMNGGDVDLVIVTGGHSQWYFVKEMLAGKMTKFGDMGLNKIKREPFRIIPISRPQETVALGLVYSPMGSSAKKEHIWIQTKDEYNFHEGLAAVWTRDGKCGYIDENEQIVIPLEWSWANPFSEGLAMVTKNGKSGYIDKNGQIKIPFEWGIMCADDFHEGLASVEKNGKWGYINKSGKVVIPYEWNEAGDFKNGVAEVKKNGEGYIIDNVGRVIYKKPSSPKATKADSVKDQHHDKDVQCKAAMNTNKTMRQSVPVRENMVRNDSYTPESEFELGNIGEDYYIRK